MRRDSVCSQPLNNLCVANMGEVENTSVSQMEHEYRLSRTEKSSENIKNKTKLPNTKIMVSYPYNKQNSLCRAVALCGLSL